MAKNKPNGELIVDLVTRAQNGDKAAFGELYKMFRQCVYAFALRMTHCAYEADDVTQCVFLLVLRKICQLTNPEAFRGWIMTMTCRMVATRKRRHKAMSFDSTYGYPEQIQNRGPLPETILMDTEAANLLRKAIEQLSADRRHLIVSRNFDGRSEEDLAKELGVPKGTIRSRSHRARKKLAEILSPLLMED